MAWTDERIALLKKYWAEGHSASQIAELLGDGLSRNAIIGKAHRMGLAARPSPLKTASPKTADPAGKAPAKRAARPKVEAAPSKAAAPPPPPPETAKLPPIQPAPAIVEEVRIMASKPDVDDEAILSALAAPVARPASRKSETRASNARVTLLDLNERICKWPIGHPDEADFHFCGKTANPGFPYCVDHCLVAYQAQMPRRERAPGEPPRPNFGPNLPRPR